MRPCISRGRVISSTESGPRAGQAFVLAAGIGIGALTAIQSRANGSLAADLGSGLHAAVVSFGVGLVVLGLLAAASARLRRAIRSVVSGLRDRSLPRWQVLGGVLGALFILSQSVSVPTIGVALFAVSLVAGQNTASLLVDAWGLGPRGKQPISSYRFLSAGLGILAVVAATSGRLGSEDFSLPFVLLVVAAGIGVAFQQAMNARVVARTGEPLTASYVTFIGGGLLLGVILAIQTVAAGSTLQPLPAWPLWLYLGGLIGAVWVATAAWVVGRTGVLALGLLTTAGQLLGALVLDLLLTDVVDVHLLVGMTLAFLAVAVAPGPQYWRRSR